jgi:hypothetical protein
MEFKDRVPTYPNRKKITYEDGKVEYVTIENADEPVEQGTPLNKATFDTIQRVGIPIIGQCIRETSSVKEVVLGFSPSLVLIWDVAFNPDAIYMISKDFRTSTDFEITSNGFKIASGANRTYKYVAWRDIDE